MYIPNTSHKEGATPAQNKQHPLDESRRWALVGPAKTAGDVASRGGDAWLLGVIFITKTRDSTCKKWGHSGCIINKLMCFEMFWCWLQISQITFHTYITSLSPTWKDQPEIPETTKGHISAGFRGRFQGKSWVQGCWAEGFWMFFGWQKREIRSTKMTTNL